MGRCMRKIVLTCAAVALAVTGCTVDPGMPVQVPAKKADVVVLDELTLRAEGAYTDPSNSRNPTLDALIRKQCTPPPPPPPVGTTIAVIPAILAPIAIAAIGWAINYFIADVSRGLQEDIQKYSAIASGKVEFGPLAAEKLHSTDPRAAPQAYFYQAIPSARRGAPTLGWNCVRLQRMVETTSKAKVIASEVILKVEVASTGDSLVIRPLRLYFDQPLPEKVDKKPSDNADGFYGVAVGMSFDGLWQNSVSGEGKAVAAWSAPDLVKQSIKISEPNYKRFYYYNLPGAAAADETAGDSTDKTPKPMSKAAPRQVPLVPWSVNAAPGTPGGSGTLTVSMAETGNVPPMLTFFAGVLKTKGSDISGLLAGAAEAALGLK